MNNTFCPTAGQSIRRTRRYVLKRRLLSRLQRVSLDAFYSFAIYFRRWNTDDRRCYDGGKRYRYAYARPGLGETFTGMALVGARKPVGGVWLSRIKTRVNS